MQKHNWCLCFRRGCDDNRSHFIENEMFLSQNINKEKKQHTMYIDSNNLLMVVCWMSDLIYFAWDAYLWKKKKLLIDLHLDLTWRLKIRDEFRRKCWTSGLYYVYYNGLQPFFNSDPFYIFQKCSPPLFPIYHIRPVKQKIKGLKKYRVIQKLKQILQLNNLIAN